MNKGKNRACIDCGSQYCPCHLAYSGDCIKCSLLRGEKTCDCLWQGICVYNEVQHNKKESLINERKEYLCEINNKEELKDGIYLLEINIPKNLTEELSKVGAYILLKDKGKENLAYNTPISVMDVDKENKLLKVVIKKAGIKTKALLDSKEVIVKGPYFNGIFGVEKINNIKSSNCLVVLSGLSQVNSINVIKKLLKNKNTVEVFYNKNSTILDVVIETLNNMGVNIHIIDIEEDKNFIQDYIKRNNVSLIYSGGNNNFNKKIKGLVDDVSKEITLAISNNNLICCGEGICGACTINLNGEKIKTCKTQINSKDFFQIM
ncbi:hypothetical protein [Romboutsia sp. 1001713B170207_170306_H8]|uniref:hypothetical protein n=1 Tax=Romboutsia sp. 1001713B170207_170306_H8 TaxID=2787112 RepID=UPI00189AFBDA|nr:hypothetical protein [Romboutsia sp. 1001713B170207_170306_H8]